MVSTYLSQLDATAVAILVSIGAGTLLIAFLFMRTLRRRSQRRLLRMRVTAMTHRVGNGMNLLEDELHACIARERWNGRMRCFGGEVSGDKNRINEIRELLNARS